VKSPMIKHPMYNSRTQNNDFMLFMIEPVTKAHLKPIRLNWSKKAEAPGKSLKVIGMGSLNRAGTSYRPELKQTTVRAVSHQACNSRYGFISSKSMICASGGSRTDSCYGDSGGPLFTMGPNPALVGVVSFGVECASAYYPGVYAKISGNINWIKNKICSMSQRKPKFCARRRRKRAAAAAAAAADRQLRKRLSSGRKLQ